ncbi:hypothetical protein [Sinorhizobium chiapasense]|uniref:Uncharacterized protein n=1 Tax=Sinorhizobium chiapasense TaxID=501572 RepID=A0ABZ2BH03_9HYPH
MKPADLPTASLAFNTSNLAGTTLGVGIVSNFVTERQKFHSNVVTEGVSLYHTLDADRISGLAGALASRVTDDATATARAVAQISAAARRQAWTLAFDDGFVVVALMLMLGIVGVIAIGRSPALPRPVKISQGKEP